MLRTWYLMGMIYEEAAGIVVQKEIPIPNGVYYRVPNQYYYSLTDHLGNVRAVVARATTVPKYFADYYPFGWKQPGRSHNDVSLNYRYGYQGQENDKETGWDAFELRMWDGRIGRWMTIDPKRAHYSPYLGLGNNPVRVIDPDGGAPVDWVKNLKTGEYVWMDNVVSEATTPPRFEYIGKDLPIGDDFTGNLYFLNATKSVGGFGHAAILLQDRSGYKLFSRNGTAKRLGEDTGGISGIQGAPDIGTEFASFSAFRELHKEYDRAMVFSLTQQQYENAAAEALKGSGEYYALGIQDCLDLVLDVMKAANLDTETWLWMMTPFLMMLIPNSRFNYIQKQNGHKTFFIK